MTRYVDLAYRQDDDSIFDFEVEDGDLRVVDGLESSILVSLFSDRRADESEVADPMKRRGWIGDTVSGETGDRHGSGLWLYDQKRLTQEIATGVRIEAEQCLDWMVDDGIVTYVSGEVVMIPSQRRLGLRVTLHFVDGSVTQRSFALADATMNGTITTNPMDIGSDISWEGA